MNLEELLAQKPQLLALKDGVRRAARLTGQPIATVRDVAASLKKSDDVRKALDARQAARAKRYAKQTRYMGVIAHGSEVRIDTKAVADATLHFDLPGNVNVITMAKPGKELSIMTVGWLVEVMKAYEIEDLAKLFLAGPDGEKQRTKLEKTMEGACSVNGKVSFHPGGSPCPEIYVQAVEKHVDLLHANAASPMNLNTRKQPSTHDWLFAPEYGDSDVAMATMFMVRDAHEPPMIFAEYPVDDRDKCKIIMCGNEALDGTGSLDKDAACCKKMMEWAAHRRSAFQGACGFYLASEGDPMGRLPRLPVHLQHDPVAKQLWEEATRSTRVPPRQKFLDRINELFVSPHSLRAEYGNAELQSKLGKSEFLLSWFVQRVCNDPTRVYNVILFSCRCPEHFDVNLRVPPPPYYRLFKDGRPVKLIGLAGRR